VGVGTRDATGRASSTIGTRRTAGSTAIGGVALLLGAILLTGCSGGGSSDQSSAGAAQDMAGSAGSRSSAEGSGGAVTAPDAGRAGANRTQVQTRAIIRTGEVELLSDDLGEVRSQVASLLSSLGGSIDSEEASHTSDGAVVSARLVLRVPVADFDEAMNRLESFARVQSSRSSGEDVTTQVIDVAERVETLQNSLDRLQRFQRRAADIDDLIAFEEQITEREAELRSLQAQQAYLTDQTSMSTITLLLSRPDHPVTSAAEEDQGFWAGLRGGWEALSATVVLALTVAGALLPFLAVAALIGVPVWLLVRRWLRKQPPPPLGTTPDAG
jgi:hypothetical protein